MIPVEQRLREHFAGKRFRPEPEWEARMLRELRVLPRPRLSSVVTHGRRVRLFMTLAMVTLLTLLAVITAIPAFAATKTPGWAAGLRSAIGIDKSGGDQASSWGYTLDLIGAYTDDRRTVVVMKGHGVGSPTTVSGGSLTAAGHRLDFQQSVRGDDGYYAVKFPALPQVQSTPTPVTLRLVGGFPLPHFWTFTFTLKLDVSPAQTIPEPGRAGKLAINFNRVRAVPGALRVRFTESGASYDELFTPAAPPITHARSGVPIATSRMLLMHSQVFDAGGKPLLWFDTQVDPTVDGVTFDEVFLRTGPGPYRLVITAPDGATLQRVIRG